MHLLRGLVAALVLLLGVAAQDSDLARLQQVLADAGCQTTLPGATGDGGGGDDPDAAGRGGAGGRARRRDAWSPHGLSVPTGLAQVVLWTGVALAAAALVAALLRRSGQRAAGPQAGAPRGGRPAAPPSPPPGEQVPDHEQKARAGDFVAALRALLQRALAVAPDASGEPPVHATAREVLRRLRRQPVPVEPLARLVAVVERVHFGGRGADRALYEDSRLLLAQWEDACGRRR